MRERDIVNTLTYADRCKLIVIAYEAKEPFLQAQAIRLLAQVSDAEDFDQRLKAQPNLASGKHQAMASAVFDKSNDWRSA